MIAASQQSCPLSAEQQDRAPALPVPLKRSQSFLCISFGLGGQAPQCCQMHWIQPCPALIHLLIYLLPARCHNVAFMNWDLESCGTGFNTGRQATLSGMEGEDRKSASSCANVCCSASGMLPFCSDCCWNTCTQLMVHWCIFHGVIHLDCLAKVLLRSSK